jgi:LDH2 family malate/lactate/ureidoglycolate dehydrogenase
MKAADAVARLSAALGGGAAADLAAAALIEAEQLGQPRFGLAMLDEWRDEAAPPAGAAGALAWHDCAAAFAPLAVAAATLEIERAARTHGIAARFLSGVRGFGRMAPFVRHLADVGLIGLAGAEGPPIVAPEGGTQAVIGTNPLALAMGQGAAQVVIDFATASATMAELRAARANGRPLPEGAAVDAAGRPTCDATEVAALLPRGGRVGSLLGLVVELLAGVAGGGRGDAKGRGVFLLALDPAAAPADDDWRDRLAGLQADWTGAQGHWPRGGGLAADATLGAELVSRLETGLARLAGERA